MSLLSETLARFGISKAEYAVLWHVRDTVVQPRDVLAAWVAGNLPNHVSAGVAVSDCLLAIDALVCRGLLVELLAADLEADRVRWRDEALPVSQGADRDRRLGDLDLSDEGFCVIDGIMRATSLIERRPETGFNDDDPDAIRVFGETEEACRRAAENVAARLDDAVRREPMCEIGPWWHSRFELIATGFEIVLRRG